MGTDAQKKAVAAKNKVVDGATDAKKKVVSAATDVKKAGMATVHGAAQAVADKTKAAFQSLRAKEEDPPKKAGVFTNLLAKGRKAAADTGDALAKAKKKTGE